MQLKRLDITGFKSFMDRSVLAFDHGITAVVGPNGCGKSNVVDAIRWAMGEQSAKNLRGRGMEDVIFNGSESESPRSMAEVSLTFSVDAADVLPQPYAGFGEVTVTRRLFRSGDSEYLINKSSCRLLDITELFLGTGVGTRAYSIIEQGRVGFIVSAKPEERRAVIEEAAGVTKYKARRKAAERKMEYTQQNLVRVTDLVRELDRQLDALTRQARKAEKYQTLKTKLRDIEVHFAAHRFLELTAEMRRLEVEVEALAATEAAQTEELERLEQGIVARRDKLEQESSALQADADALHVLESALEKDEQNLAFWRQDMADSTLRRNETLKEEAGVRAREVELSERLDAVANELQSLTDLQQHDDVERGTLSERQSILIARQSVLLEDTEAKREGLVAMAARVANHESNLASFARQSAELSTRQARVRNEIELLRAEEAELEKLRANVADRVTATRQLTGELAIRKGQEQETLAAARQEHAENEVLMISARERLADLRSRLQSLEEVQRNYEGFDRGVRALMKRGGSEKLVADVLVVPPRFEKAVEAALGDRLQHVLVSDRNRALELVEGLRRSEEGRSSFIPLPDLRRAIVRSSDDTDLSFPGVVALARREVRCEAGLETLVEALLADVVILEDLPAARAFFNATGAGLTLVTLEGDVLRHDGTVTGGLMEGPAVGALQKKREIAERAEEAAIAELRYHKLVTSHGALQGRVAEAEDAIAGLAQSHHAEELNLAHQEKDLHKAGEDLSRLRSRLTLLEAEGQEIAAVAERLLLDEASARTALAEAQAERGAGEESLRRLAGEMETLKLEAEVLTSDLTAIQVRAAAHAERSEAVRREQEAVRGLREEATARLDKLAETAAQLLARCEEREKAIAEVETTQEPKRIEREQRAEQLVARRDAHAREVTEVRTQEQALRELRTMLEATGTRRSEAAMVAREAELARGHLVEAISDRHALDLLEQVQRFHMAAPLPAHAEQESKDLRAQIEKMGEINLTAIEEHAQVKERCDFLKKQQLDLASSLERLAEAIRRIDETSRERFRRTFQVVNEKFEQVFPRLFGGGRAGLLLVDSPTGGEPGVEIVAQPPGKKLQSVSLLSGGEKALTAVSLIFAIFLIKPTPFCLLDEVDAPLDDGNVGRYNEIVREMSQRSQFILITHNKRTMEIADTLYGITMEEPGISKLVAVQMKDAETLSAASEEHAA
ncbi:MAG: chromosome segregation protein SMC [Myxococcaceae bacterium]